MSVSTTPSYWLTVVNGIENFWNQPKRHLRKFNGIKRDNFYWFLKDKEWRFNGAQASSLPKGS